MQGAVFLVKKHKNERWHEALTKDIVLAHQGWWDEKNGLSLPDTPDLRHLVIASSDDTCIIGRPGKAIHDAREVAPFAM